MAYPTTYDNIAADKQPETLIKGDHAGHHDILAAGVNAVQSALGLVPQGSYLTVAARLAALTDGTFTGAVMKFGANGATAGGFHTNGLFVGGPGPSTGADFGNATNAILIKQGSPPTADPVNAGILYVEGDGALKYRSRFGTITTITDFGDQSHPWTYVVKQTDETLNTNTTGQTDDELFFPTVAGVFYEVELALIYGNPVGGTCNAKFGIGEDSTVRGAMTMFGVRADGAAVVSNVLANQDLSTLTPWQSALADRSINGRASVWGNGGTCALVWSQGTSSANNLIVRAGSRLAYRRVV